MGRSPNAAPAPTMEPYLVLDTIFRREGPDRPRISLMAGRRLTILASQLGLLLCVLALGALGLVIYELVQHPGGAVIAEWIVLVLATVIAAVRRGVTWSELHDARQLVRDDSSAPGQKEVESSLLPLMLDHGREVVRAQVGAGDSQIAQGAGFAALLAAGVALAIANHQTFWAWAFIAAALLIGELGMGRCLLRGDFKAEEGLREFWDKYSGSDYASASVALLRELRTAEGLNAIALRAKRADFQFGLTMLSAGGALTVIGYIR